ncbi:MAG: hypothetical protein K2P93_08205 [Alphaproteobacteria bacterium]|nr:hypothetical protein [Alphaproteobacteria bacterium]
MNQSILFLSGAFLWTGYALAADDYKKYIPEFAQQYILDSREDDPSSSPQKEDKDFQKYIPEPYQKYVPEFMEERESLEDTFWDEDWDEEASSSSKKSSLKNKEVYGPSSLSNNSYHNLTGNGPLRLTHVTVENRLSVNGPLVGSNIQAGFLEVNGPVNVSNLDVGKAVIRGFTKFKSAHVKKGLTIYGTLFAQGSTFKQPIHVFSSKIRFTDSQVHSIVFEKNENSSNEPPVIHLLGGTQVFGDIEFKGKQGIVDMGPDAKVDGKIINGIQQSTEK